MNRFRRDVWSATPIRIAVLLFVFAVLVRLGNWFVMGTALGGDWKAYQQACHLWWSNPIGILTAKKGVVYAGFTFPFCSITELPFTTVDTWVVIQILVSGLSVVLVYLTGASLMNRSAGTIAGIMLALLWDTFQWTTVLYSDAMFTFTIALALWVFTRYRQSGSRRVKIALLLSFGFVIITRPYGFPIVLGWIAYDIFPASRYVERPVFDTRLVGLTGIALTVLAVPFIVERYELFERWARGWTIINDQTYVYNLPVTQDTSLVGFLVGNHVHLVVLAIIKLVFFFLPFLPRHSTMHILINAVTFVPVYLLGMAGLYLAWRNEKELFRYLATPILVTLAITAITFVSWDFRYRAPLGPPIALLAGYSATQLSSRLPDRYRSLGLS